MAADWWARGIAIGSAAAASLNMVISYRTFKRGRPKIKVRLYRNGVRARKPGTEEWHHIFILRLVNHGATPVTLERVELCRYAWTYSKRRFETVDGQRFDPRGRWGNVPPIIPALDGITHNERVAGTYLDRGDHLRFRLLLSNGHTVTSPVIRKNAKKLALWPSRADTPEEGSGNS